MFTLFNIVIQNGQVFCKYCTSPGRDADHSPPSSAEVVNE
jgi:hypothetical protein